MEELFHSHHSNPVLKTAIVAIMVCCERGTNLLPRITSRLENDQSLTGGKLYRRKAVEGKEACLLLKPRLHLWSTIIIFRSIFSKADALLIFSWWLYNRWRYRNKLAMYPPWCRRERPSAGHCSPERRRRSGYPDSWRGGAAS